MKELKKFCITVTNLNEFQIAREFFALATGARISRDAERFGSPHYLCIVERMIVSYGDPENRTIVPFSDIEQLADTPERKEMLELARFRASNPDGEI